jgi:hypothetical protein
MRDPTGNATTAAPDIAASRRQEVAYRLTVNLERPTGRTDKKLSHEATSVLREQLGLDHHWVARNLPAMASNTRGEIVSNHPATP